jgi:MFS family permease
VNPTDERAAVHGPFGIYYGWVVVGVSFVTLGVAFGIWYSFSVFFLAVIQEFGWSRAAASSIFSTFILTQSLLALVAGHLMDRYGPRLVIPLGALILAVSLWSVTHVHSLWQFRLLYGVFGAVGISMMGFASHSAFLPKWFERRRGLAVGVAMSGIGVGMMVVVPVIQRWIQSYGWRSAYLFLAALVLLGVAPLNLFLSRRQPQDLHLQPDGDPLGIEAEASRRQGRIVKVIDPQWANRHWTLSSAVRTGRFWFLGAGFFFGSFTYQGTLLHSVSALVDAGETRAAAASLFGLLGVCGSVGKIVFGSLSDRLGREKTQTLAVAITSAGILSLTASLGMPGGAFPFLFAVLFGLGYGSAAPLFPSVSADIFLGSSFGLIFGLLSLGGGSGGAVGAYLCGLLRDVTGAYRAPLWVLMFSLWISCGFIWLSAPRKVRAPIKARADGKEGHPW